MIRCFGIQFQSVELPKGIDVDSTFYLQFNETLRKEVAQYTTRGIYFLFLFF